MNTNNPVPLSYERFQDGSTATTFSDGTKLLLDRYHILADGLAGDSGQISAFRPAQYNKPKGMLAPIQKAWSSLLGRPRPSQTTEQGAASAASPVTYYLTLWEQRFGRRTRIEDCRSLWLSDTRVWRSVNMYVDTALEGGPHIRVQGNDRRAKAAKEIAKKIEKIFNETLVQEWGKGLVTEGDLFTQFVIYPRAGKPELVKAVAMPAIGMERLTDDADEFINEDRAFEQIDSMTFETVSSFPSALMTHTRWAKINGDRYGSSELVTARRSIRAIELAEQALVINRMVRAPLRRLHKVGVPDNTASQQELDNYKAENSFFSGKLNTFNPQSVTIDYFGNGNTDIITLDGDKQIGQVDDVKYLSNVFMAALPTPGVFFGLNIEDAKRDVLEDMKLLWVRSHSKLQTAISEPIAHGFELALTLAGIDPARIEYSIQWRRGTLETIADTVAWLTEAKGAGGISDKTYVQEVGSIIGTTDTEQELKDIQAGQKELHTREVEKRGAGKSIKDELNDEGLNAAETKDKPKSARLTPELDD